MQVKGCCPLDCQDTCAWTANVKEGRVTHIEGAKDHPITRGVLCAKVKDYEQRVTAPARLLHPLRRSGPKGSGQFERISWEQALDEIAERFQAIIAAHGAEALLPFFYLGSEGAVQRMAPLRLFHALGASRPVGEVCGMSTVALLAEGHPLGVDPEETPHAKLVILWGQNVLSTCHHQWPFIEAARKNGAKIIAIDPCRTRTTKQCDEHIAIRPGTDAILAAALGRHLLVTGQADLDLAHKWTHDLEAYRRAVEPWSFVATAEVTGLEEATIATLAKDFAAARPALIRAGVAPQQTQSGDDLVRALSALAILGGHWRHEGGGVTIFSTPLFNETRAGRPDLLVGAPRSLDVTRLGDVLERADPPVKGLMVWAANPAVTQIDSAHVQRGLHREDLFTVVADHFLTDTARLADVVLPATTQFEHVDVQGAWGHHYVSANAAAIAPQGETRSSGAIMRGLAAKLGLTHPALHESDEDIAQSALPDDWVLADLMAEGWRKSPMPRPALNEWTQKLSIACSFVPPAPVPHGQLQLLTPKSHYFLNSTFANMPRHQTQQGKAVVHLHPKDAESRGLSAGETVTLRSVSGTIRLPVAIDDNNRRGVATLQGKWWDEGRVDAAAMNRLSPPRWAPSGQPAYNEIFVSIERG